MSSFHNFWVSQPEQHCQCVWVRGVSWGEVILQQISHDNNFRVNRNRGRCHWLVTTELWMIDSMEKTAAFKLARCLARVRGSCWDKISLQLFSKCPRISDHGTVLTSKHQEAVLALGIYYLESGFEHSERILGYLVSLVRWVILDCDWLTRSKCSLPIGQIPVNSFISWRVSSGQELQASSSRDIHLLPGDSSQWCGHQACDQQWRHWSGAAGDQC